MDRDIWLLIVGALIGFVGSTLSTFVSYVLENKRTKRQWQRDDFLQAESRKRDEIKLAQDFNMQSNLKTLSAVLRDPIGEFCFLPETNITMATRHTAAIQSLKIGDTLLSYDTEKREVIESSITEIKESYAENYVVINEKIKVTPSHLFWTSEGWKRSDEINLQSVLYFVNGDYIAVTKLEVINKRSLVYNLELTNNLPFFAESVLVSTFAEKRNYAEKKSTGIENVEIDEFGNIHRAK